MTRAQHLNLHECAENGGLAMPSSSSNLIALREEDTRTSLLTAVDGEAPRRMRIGIRVAGGPDAGKVYRSRSSRIVVGKHRDSDIVLADDAVSRFHLEIVSEGDRLFAIDLNSTNGTYLDGVRIQRAELREGTLITIGRSQLKLMAAADDAETHGPMRLRFGKMVGTSAASQRIFALMERVAKSDATILLLGETGTGKDMAAQSIHAESERRDGPFVVVDCGALPSELIESELFGHEEGAFTGAVRGRDGAFTAADGGTLFLDEIGELPLALQSKLLRVLERREVRRVGSEQYRSVDVRVIAATNRNLRSDIANKTFRSDLFYRLAVVEIPIPPLRERPEDVLPLVEHLVGAVSERPEFAFLRSTQFVANLSRHPWPGNVRELRNYLDRCVASCAPQALDEHRDAAPPPETEIDVDMPIKQARKEWVTEFERRYLTALLERTGGNVSAAARQAGVDRVHLYRLLWRYGLR